MPRGRSRLRVRRSKVRQQHWTRCGRQRLGAARAGTATPATTITAAAAIPAATAATAAAAAAAAAAMAAAAPRPTATLTVTVTVLRTAPRATHVPRPSYRRSRRRRVQRDGHSGWAAQAAQAAHTARGGAARAAARRHRPPGRGAREPRPWRLPAVSGRGRKRPGADDASGVCVGGQAPGGRGSAFLPAPEHGLAGGATAFALAPTPFDLVPALSAASVPGTKGPSAALPAPVSAAVTSVVTVTVTVEAIQHGQVVQADGEARLLRVAAVLLPARRACKRGGAGVCATQAQPRPLVGAAADARALATTTAVAGTAAPHHTVQQGVQQVAVLVHVP
jgi:hypothetical protein